MVASIEISPSQALEFSQSLDGGEEIVTPGPDDVLVEGITALGEIIESTGISTPSGTTLPTDEATTFTPGTSTTGY